MFFGFAARRFVSGSRDSSLNRTAWLARILGENTMLDQMASPVAEWYLSNHIYSFSLLPMRFLFFTIMRSTAADVSWCLL